MRKLRKFIVASTELIARLGAFKPNISRKRLTFFRSGVRSGGRSGFSSKARSNVLNRLLMSLCVSVLIMATSSGSAQRDHYDQLPDLGSQAQTFLSEEKAKLLGRSFIRQSRFRTPYISDPELVDYISRLGNRLLDVSTDAGKEYNFYLIDNDQINAFAVPGGYIALHKAILTKAETESELASVVAHEIAHVTQQHISRRLENSKYDSWIALGALLAAAAAGGADAAQAALGVSQASILDRKLSYSRDFEAEADSLGIRLLSRAGFEPKDMPVFFKRLLDENRINESRAPEFLRSHPLTISRITESAERVRAYPEAPPQDQREFKMMQAKARAVYSKDPELTKSVYAQKIKDGDKTLPTRYGYAIALSKNGEFGKARKEFKQLLADHPDNLSVILMQADNELESNNIDTGLANLRKAFKREKANGNDMVDIYYANALVLTNHHDEAIPIIRSALAQGQSEPYLHFLLARAHAANGDTKQSYIERGQYHYLRGNYEFSIEQFKRAFLQAKTEYERESLGARIVEIEEELAEIKRL